MLKKINNKHTDTKLTILSILLYSGWIKNSKIKIQLHLYLQKIDRL